MSRDYDSTVARMAGNIAGQMLQIILPQLRNGADSLADSIQRVRPIVADESVALARAIVGEVRRTEPVPEQCPEMLGKGPNAIRCTKVKGHAGMHSPLTADGPRQKMTPITRTDVAPGWTSDPADWTTDGR